MSAPLLADPDFARLKQHLIRATGLAYYADKDAELAHRLAHRLTARGARGCGEYLALLSDSAGGQAELDRAIVELTNGETFFFRHREMFAALRDVVLPDLIARNQGARRLRVWSAGCSVGAEPYSVAILLRRDFASQLAGWDARVFGTDINREFLVRARSGRFEGWAMRGLPDDVRKECFTPAGPGWAIRPEFAAGVSFEYHNLVAPEPLSWPQSRGDFDLILCRNVTIYFAPDIVRRIVGHFHQALSAGGWLVVGHSEPNIELFRAFRTVNAPGAVLYQKADSAEDRTTGSEGRVRADAGPWAPPVPVPEAPPEGAKWAPDRVPPLPAEPAVAPPEPDLRAVRALADRGAWADAARACDLLLAADSLNPAAHFYRGLVLEQADRHAEAEGALRRAIYLDRGHVLAHYYLALFLQRRGQLPEAGRCFRNALQLLDRLPPEDVFADGDGITARELAKLVRMHLETLREA